MSAFLMDRKNVSSLAYAIFTQGESNSKLRRLFMAEDIRGPEDLFVRLMKDNLKSLEARYGDKRTDGDVGEYDFDHDKLTLPDIIKGIACWQYQSRESKEVRDSDFFKALSDFKSDCAMSCVTKSEEYVNSKMWS